MELDLALAAGSWVFARTETRFDRVFAVFMIDCLLGTVYPLLSIASSLAVGLSPGPVRCSFALLIRHCILRLYQNCWPSCLLFGVDLLPEDLAMEDEMAACPVPSEATTPAIVPPGSQHYSNPQCAQIAAGLLYSLSRNVSSNPQLMGLSRGLC